MRCPTCGADASYDKVSQSYYCENCNLIFGEEDITVEKEKSDKIPIMLEIAISLCLLIPILDLIILAIILNSKIKPTYKQSYTSFLFAKVGLLSIGITYLLVSTKIDLRAVQSARHELISAIELQHNSYDIISPIVLHTQPKDKIIAKHNPTHAEQEDIAYAKLSFLDNSIITGATISELVLYADEQNIPILVQTNSIRERKSDDSYLNIGVLLAESLDIDSSKLSYYVGKLDAPMTPTSEHQDTSVINNKRYIYYINQKSSFTVRLVQDESSITAIALIEISKK